MNLYIRMLPGVLLGPGALALLMSAAQCGVEVTKIKKQLQGSVLSHGERTLLKDGGRESKQSSEIQETSILLNEQTVHLPALSSF